MTQLKTVSRSSSGTIGSLKFYWYILTRNPLTIVGLSIMIGLIIIAVFAPWLSPYNPYETSPTNTLAAPTLAHPFGTDIYGRDSLSRTFYATSLDLSLAIVSVLAATAGGVIIGSITGYFGGRLDDIIMRGIDSVLAFPSFVLGMALMVSLGAGLINLLITQTVIRIPIFTRVTRGEILSAKNNEYAEAAKCVGDSDLRIIFRNLLPNCSTPIIVFFTLNLGYAVLEIASLSFLGLGINPPTPEWGLMVAYGSTYLLSGQWFLSFFPGLFIVLAVLAFNLIGDGIRDLLERRVR
jgi:peptide/nickel transport system permease protein